MEFLSFELYLAGIHFFSNPLIYIYLFLGTMIGIIFGSLPGLTSTMALAVFVPFTFGLDPILSFAFLLAIYMSSVYGGSISAILINIPGTPSAVATAMDGYPLCQKGRAGEAIGVATVSSALGGLISVFFLAVMAPVIADFALEFSAQEYVGLALLGISVIAMISSTSMIKGLITGIIGLFIGSIGLDTITGYPRFVFSMPELFDGLSLIPVMIGMFGLTEIFEQIANQQHLSIIPQKLAGLLPPLSEFLRLKWSLLRASIVGVIIGAIPATGGSVAAVVSYALEKRFSKRGHLFGTGIIDGVAVPETANNATVGGALVPMLTLGIPGDPMTAVLIGALIMHGLRPGPLLFTQQMPFVSSIFISLFLSVAFMLVIGLVGARYFAKLITIPKSFLIPAILLFCLIGSYAINNSIFDVGILIVSGIIGFVLKKFGFPVQPIILGLILGPIFEENLRRSMILSDGNWSTFITRPISLVLFIIVAFVLFAPYVLSFIKNRYLHLVKLIKG